MTCQVGNKLHRIVLTSLYKKGHRMVAFSLLSSFDVHHIGMLPSRECAQGWHARTVRANTYAAFFAEAFAKLLAANSQFASLSR